MSDNASPRMGITGVITIVVVIVYVGLELYGLHHARERMAPEQVFREFVGARHAMRRCKPEVPENRDFERNFQAVSARALKALHEQMPEGEGVEVLANLRRVREAEVDALIRAEGCEGKGVWKLLKVHEIRGRLNLRS